MFFRGAGWNVIKVVWGRNGTTCSPGDVDGALVNRMNTVPDGQFQTYSVESGAYIRENFFGGDAAAAQARSSTSLRHRHRDCCRGAGTTTQGVRRVQGRADHVGQPTVILAHTVKGWTIEALEGKNATHQMKKLERPPRSSSSRPARAADLRQGDRRRLRGRPAPRRSTTRARAATSSSTSATAAASSGGPVPERRSAQPLEAPGRRDVRRAEAGLGQAVHRHHDGARPAAQRPDEGPGDRPADRADRAGRVPHVRHGLDVLQEHDLQPARPELRGRGPQAADGLQGVRRTGSCCTRASPRPARWPRRPPPARRTPRTAST